MTSRCTSVLSTHADAPIVAKSTMQAASLHPLKIFTQRLIQEVCVLLASFPIFHVTLFVQHPRRNLELERIADHCHDFVDLVRREFSGSLVQVDVAFLANDVGEASTDTLDSGQRKHDLL